MATSSSPATLEKIVALCKRKGFVYPSADIYGGINGIYDFGPLGHAMRQNIRNFWQRALTDAHDNVLFMDGAILGPRAMWEASGHTKSFHDPMVDCLKCKHRFRADHIDLNKACSHCGAKEWTEVRQFNMMFRSELGALAENVSEVYLRPETAQAIFVNFKNILSSNRIKIPFGVAQIGKAFRNEITAKQFLFRMREFEQMELEWFCKPEQAQEFFDYWQQERKKFYLALGIKAERIRLRPHKKDELAHYSTCCTDVEYHFPFGWQELEGIAHRGDYDLSQHIKHSGKDLSVFDDETKKSFVPNVIECSVGVDRLFLTLLFDAYDEDKAEGEQRIVLRLHPRVAPIKAAFMPLTKKQTAAMEKIYRTIKQQHPHVQLDVSGSIGKRYRRQDEIGTPLCFTYDFESDADQKVTVRDRDTMQQERIAIDAIEQYLAKRLA